MKPSNILWWAIEVASVISLAVLTSYRVSLWWLILPVGGFVVGKVLDFRSGIHDRKRQVEGQLRLLMRLIDFNPEWEVRATFHVPTRFGKLRQVVDYLPSGGGAGRSFPRDKGIIGKAFREKRLCVESFEDDKDYRTQMVLKYRYSETELAQRSADRRSYFCFPLVDESHKVLALVYLDSDERRLFDESSTLVSKLIVACDIIQSSLI